MNVYIYDKDTKMTSIGYNLRKHPLFSQEKITVLYHATDS